MRPTEILKHEHEVIGQMLKVTEVISRLLISGQKVDPEHLEQVIHFFKGFADRCHHGKEENLLFKAMIKAGLSSEGGPIRFMLSEHEMGREYIRMMAKGAEEYKKAQGNASGLDFVTGAQHYVSLLAQHIRKEDTILFVLADKILSEKQQIELKQDFEKMEHDEMGVGTHEHYLKILDDLKARYLKETVNQKSH